MPGLNTTLRLSPLARRALIAGATVVVAMTLTFFLIRSTPGDAVETLAGQIATTRGIGFEEARDMARTMLSYDPNEPLLLQYAHYVGRLLHGDLGTSLVQHIPVTTIVLAALPWTLLITGTATGLSFTVGLWLGLAVAWRRKTMLDPLLTLYATVTQAVPSFLIALLLMVVFGLWLRWLPMLGAYGVDTVPGWSASFAADVLVHAVLPVAAFALPSVGGWILAMKASALSVISEDYVQVARAKGLRERRILLQYVGLNAVLPLISTLTASLGTMLGGSMLVETVFGYPGLGYFLRQAIATRDYPVMQGIFLVVTVSTVAANLLGDVLAIRLNPRLRTR